MKMASGGEQNYNKDIQNLYKECVTPVLKTLLLQRVKELKEPNQPEGKWTLNLFLHKNKRKIIPCLRDDHLEDVLYPYEEPTNLDNWDFTAYVLVLLNTCKLNESLQNDLINLDELAKKIHFCQNNKLSEGIYYAYRDRIRCRITQICISLDDGGQIHNILSRFDEMCPLISRSKYPNGFAQKYEKDVQVVSQRDSDAITYLEWIEDRLKVIEVNPLIPEIEVVVILRHYNQNDEQRVSRYIETAFMEAVKKYDVDVSTSQDEKEINLNQEEAAFFESEVVKEHIQFLVRRLFEGQQRVTSVTTGCVKLKIQCETVGAVIDLLEQSINGLLTFNLVTLEDQIRLFRGHELFDIYVGVTRESCWKLVNEMKTAAFGGYRSGRFQEKLTFNHKRIEDGQLILIKSRPTTVTSVQDLRRIFSTDERMQTCRKLSELLTRQFPSSEGTINMSVKVIPDIEVISKYEPDVSEWKEDGTLDTMTDSRKKYFESMRHVYPKGVVSEFGRKNFDIPYEDSSPHPPHIWQKRSCRKRIVKDLTLKSMMNPEISSWNKDKKEKEIRAVKVQSKFEPGPIKLKEDITLLNMEKLRLKEMKSNAYYKHKRRPRKISQISPIHEPTDAPTLKYIGEMKLLGPDGHGEVGYISGMAFIGDRFLVATDMAKRCLRCFDMESGKQQGGRYDSEFLFWDITAIPGNRVAVFSDYDLWFLRVTEQGDLLFENKIDVNKHCIGIASSGDNLIVCYKYPAPGVQILDMMGNVIKEFEKDDECNNLFVNPVSLTVSPDHSTIYILDLAHAKPMVTALTQDGRVLSVVDVKYYLHYKPAITVDSAGRVYICDDHDVLLVSLETGTVTPLLEAREELRYPSCVAVCDKTQRLYVGSEYNSVIKVFGMQTTP